MDDEIILNNILIELTRSEDESGVKVHSLFKHFESFSKRYDSTLKRLAE